MSKKYKVYAIVDGKLQNVVENTTLSKAHAEARRFVAKYDGLATKCTVYISGQDDMYQAQHI